MPDPEFRQSLVAAVQTQDGISLTAQQVRDFLSNKLANFKVPRVVEFRDSLPREDTGEDMAVCRDLDRTADCVQNLPHELSEAYMANLIEQAIACDDGDRAAKIIQDALGIESGDVANYVKAIHY